MEGMRLKKKMDENLDFLYTDQDVLFLEISQFLLNAVILSQQTYFLFLKYSNWSKFLKTFIFLSGLINQYTLIRGFFS